MKTILIISGGIEALPGIRRARAMGLRVVVSDMNPNAPGFALADARLIASTYDGEGTLAAARAYIAGGGRIDGVIAMGADVPLTVALLADALGLPGISMASARLAADKLAMKERLAERGVPVPWFSGIETADHLRHIRARRTSPLVVKPVDSRGSRGVVRLMRDIDTCWAFEQAAAISPSGRVMVEDYLEGPQVSTESLILPDGLFTPGFSDRNYELLEAYAPYFIENGGDLPSHLPADIQSSVHSLIRDAAAALELTTGSVKGDVVVSGAKPHIIEIAPRLSGGYFSSLEIPLNTGVDFVGAAIRLALGEAVTAAEATASFQRPVVQRYVFPPPGIIASINGVEEAKRLPGIAHLIVSARPGEAVSRTRDTTSRAVMVIAVGDTLEEARARAATALGMVRIEMMNAGEEAA